jgi:hypothetical protein
LSYSTIYNVNKCNKVAGNFDDHDPGKIQRESHCLMKCICGFMQSHWMLSLGKCPCHITLAAAMVIAIGVSKKHHTQLGFT